MYHYDYSGADNTETVGAASIAANEVCVFEIHDTTTYDKSKFNIEIRSGSSSEFEIGVFIKSGVKNEYESCGSLYEGDDDDFTVTSGDDDSLFIVVKPKTSASFYADITHEGEGGFVWPWWGWMLVGICGFFCFVCCIFLLSCCSAKAKQRRYKRANTTMATRVITPPKPAPAPAPAPKPAPAPAPAAP